MDLKIFCNSLTETEKRDILTILDKSVTKRKTIVEWVAERPNLPSRLRTGLLNNGGLRPYAYMDEITVKQNFRRIRNLGKKSWYDFLDALET